MKALCWHGRNKVTVDTVDDPMIQDPRDAIIRVTSTAICGSDLHIYDGYIPMMKSGDGPVGQFAIRSAYMLGAERVIAIDRVGERLDMAASDGRTEVLNYEEQKDVVEYLKYLTKGRGPDRCIDAVGSEAHGTGPWYIFDRVEQAVRLESDRPYVLRQAIQACRKGGTVSVPGVYGGFIDKMPMGAFVNKGLTMKSGQTHVHRYLQPLMRRIEEGEIDPSFVITHRVTLDEFPEMYRVFRDKEDGCIKVVGKPATS
jgi:threonine dehydrogenase-like Zn-dependent dehydrogenase